LEDATGIFAKHEERLCDIYFEVANLRLGQSGDKPPE